MGNEIVVCNRFCCSELRSKSSSAPNTLQTPGTRNGSAESEQERTPTAETLESLSDDELLRRLKELLKTKAKSRKEAFDLLGGSDDGRIDKEEFDSFLAGDFGSNSSLLDRTFCLLDVNGDGFISAAEFKQLAVGSESKDNKSESKDPSRKRSSTIEKPAGNKDELKKELAQFKAFVKKNFKSPKQAFEGLDSDGSAKVDVAEFKRVLKLRRYPGDADKVFEQLDKDNDGDITWDEFRKQIDTKGIAKEEMRNHFDRMGF